MPLPKIKSVVYGVFGALFLTFVFVLAFSPSFVPTSFILSHTQLPQHASMLPNEPTSTVTLAILVRNSDSFLQFYLECLEKQDYPKNLISVFIRTNDNTDTTYDILVEWKRHWEHVYARVVMDASTTQHNHPDAYSLDETRLNYENKWTGQKLTLMGRLREQTLAKARYWDTDYFFTADADNFLVSSTLSYMVSLHKDFVGPMLRYPVKYENHGMHVPWTNHFNAVHQDKRGYYFWRESPFDDAIRERAIRGTIEVPLMQCTYLLSRKAINKLTYLADNEEFEFHVLSASARKAGIMQFVDNTRRWGYAIYLDSSVSYIKEAMTALEIEFAQLSTTPPVYTTRVYVEP